MPVDFDKNGNAKLGYTESGARFSRGMANAARIAVDAGRFARNKGMMQRVIQQNVKVPQSTARAQQVAVRDAANATAARNIMAERNARVAQATKQVTANNAAKALELDLLDLKKLQEKHNGLLMKPLLEII